MPIYIDSASFRMLKKKKIRDVFVGSEDLSKYITISYYDYDMTKGSRNKKNIFLVVN